MSFHETAEALLRKKNVSMRCDLGYIQDLHRFVREDILIINKTRNPHTSPRCQMLKAGLVYLLENYDTIKKSIPNARIK